MFLAHLLSMNGQSVKLIVCCWARTKLMNFCQECLLNNWITHLSWIFFLEKNVTWSWQKINENHSPGFCWTLAQNINHTMVNIHDFLLKIIEFGKTNCVLFFSYLLFCFLCFVLVVNVYLYWISLLQYNLENVNGCLKKSLNDILLGLKASGF